MTQEQKAEIAEGKEFKHTMAIIKYLEEHGFTQEEIALVGTAMIVSTIADVCSTDLPRAEKLLQRVFGGLGGALLIDIKATPKQD